MTRAPEPSQSSLWERLRESASPRERIDLLYRDLAPRLAASARYRYPYLADLAEDLVQDCMLRVVAEPALIDQAIHTRGNSLRLMLRNHIIDRHRRRQAEERALAREAEQADPDPLPESHPDDQRRAVEIFAEAARRTYRECQADGRMDLWHLFEGRALVILHGQEPLNYRDLAAWLKLRSEHQAGCAADTSRKRFRRHLGATLRERCATAADGERDMWYHLLNAGPEMLEALRLGLFGDLPALSVSSGSSTRLVPALLVEELRAPAPPERAAEARRLFDGPVFEAGDLPEKLARPVQAAEARAGRPASFAQLLQEPTPDEPWLQLGADFGKHNSKFEDSPLSKEAAFALYYGCIAVGLVRLNKRLTGLSDADLRYAFGEWAPRQDWAPAWLRQLYREALAGLTREGA